MELEQILLRFFDVVANNKKHKHFNTTVARAKKYRQLVAGENIDALLKQFVRREDDALFEQRKTLTKHITTAICKNLMDVFFKVPRSNTARRILAYKDDAEAKIDELNGILAKFWGIETFDDYLATRFIELNHVDPNAFVVFEFKPFDNETELVQPYPFEVFSQNAIDFGFENRVLNYLIVQGKITLDNQDINNRVETILPNDKNTIKGDKFTLYTKNQTFQLIELSKNNIPSTPTDVEGKIYKFQERSFVRLGKKIFEFKTFLPHNCERVPAFRVGYVRDLLTDGETMVSPIHAAEPFLEKTIKVNSELDLVATLLAHPQQIKYGKKCEDDQCYKGYYDNGTQCKTCGGTGIKPTAGSAQDAIVIEMPDSKEEMLPLSEIISYIHPPIDVIKWQDEYIEKQTRKAKQIVFNSGIFDKAEIAETATGKNIDLQNVYDTLYPLATAFSRNWENGVQIVAKLADREKGLIAKYTFGKDFKLKTLNDLMLDLKEANDSNADDALVRSINNDIAEIIFSEQPIELNRYKVKQVFNPFSGKSEKEIVVLMNSTHVPMKSKVLYANYGLIFDELELEYSGQGKDFYKLKRSLQREAIMKKVEEIMQTTEEENKPPELELGE